jgi:hypothetical protein
LETKQDTSIRKLGFHGKRIVTGLHKHSEDNEVGEKIYTTRFQLMAIPTVTPHDNVRTLHKLFFDVARFAIVLL